MTGGEKHRVGIDAQALSLMVLVCSIWGFQQVAMKAAAADVSPILQVSIRSGFASIIVAAMMVVRKERPSLASGTWKPGLLVGFLFALEFLLVGEGLRYTTASHSVMFLYTAPIFAALGLHWKLPSERLRTLQWVGILIAMAGVVVTFAGGGSHGAGQAVRTAPNMLLGDFLALLGGVAWGMTTVAVRTSSLSRAPATETLLYQLLGAFTVLLAASFLLGQTALRPTPLVLGNLAFQTLVVSVASFLIWFSMLRRYLASRLGVLSFMTPLFGIAFGVALLGEPLQASFVAGSGLVVLGILLVSGDEWLSALIRTRRGAQPL